MQTFWNDAARRVAVLTAALAVGLLPATVDTAPARAVPQTQQSAPRAQHVTVGGVYGARTFGNYRTVDGHTVTDRVMRSGDLQNLDNTGLAVLRSRRVASIVDLRTGLERAVKPNRVVPGARLHHFDVMSMAPLAGSADFPGMYRTFVDNPAAREAYRKTLLEVARTVPAGESIVVHCSAGRDRTGWASAVLLRVAGVPMSVIESDFRAGNNGVDVAWLRGAFAHADRLFGGFTGYLRQGLNLSETDIARVRAAMLA